MSSQVTKLIESREDIELMVNSFYEKVRQDPLIGPKFNEIAKVDWAKHLPKMYSFWSDLLLGTEEYRGRPFPPHVPLDLFEDHFARWVELFNKTVDEHFHGLKAHEVKFRAQSIAMNFRLNLEMLRSQK